MAELVRHKRGGIYFEDFQVGAVIEHGLTRTVTQMDNMLFSNMTLNPQPLHIDAHFCATETEWGKPLMNSLFTLGLMIGISVNDTTVGTTIAWPNVGTTISWPDVAGEKTATGNDGLVQTIATTPYSIGYVGISYGGQIAKAGLGTAMIKNQNGKFLLPTPQTIAAAAAELDPRTPPYERITLIFAPGESSYPLINYEYAVVSKSQPDAATADALRSFLLWAISEAGGNSDSYLKPVGFIPLPNFIRGLSEAQIAAIQ